MIGIDRPQRGHNMLAHGSAVGIGGGNGEYRGGEINPNQCSGCNKPGLEGRFAGDANLSKRFS